MEQSELSEEQKKVLKDFVETLKNDYRYNIELFDKQAIYIAGGSLAISLTFIKDIVPLEKTIFLWLYYTSISFFALSILLGFLSFLISSEIINNNKRYLEGDRKRKYRKDRKYIKDNVTSILNYFNAGLITLGIIIIVAFTIFNLNNYKSTINNLKIKTMEQKEKRIVSTENEGTMLKSLRGEDLPASLSQFLNTNSSPQESNSSVGTADSSSNQQNSSDE